MNVQDILSLTQRGWHVIPLHDLSKEHCSCSKGRDCRTPGKHPRLNEWQDKGTIDAATIQRWWRRWPHANIGIVTGVASRLAVLDVDPRHDGDDALRDLEQCYKALPETPMVISGGGGQHYYFALGAEMPSAVLAHGLEFLAGNNHQIVAPPSLHPSGRRYAWEICREPDDVPLAPLPAWMLALVEDKTHAISHGAHKLPCVLPEIDIRSLRVSPRMKELIRMGTDPQRYHSRSECVFAVTLALINVGYSDETIAAVLLDPVNGISDKPLGQKNSRDPRYGELTRAWIAKEITRARNKRKVPRRLPCIRKRHGIRVVEAPTHPYHRIRTIEAQEVPLLWH